MAVAGHFTIIGEAQTLSTAITILEVTMPASSVGRVYHAWCTQTGLTSSTRLRMEILRKSGTITGTASPPTARPTQTGYAAFDGTVKWIATGEGTDGVILDSQAWDALYGYEWGSPGWQYTNAGFFVPPSGIIALKFPAAPSSASYTFGLQLEAISG